MNPTDPLPTTRQALHEVAPEADLDRLDPAAGLQDSLELDSLDFLRFVELLSERTGLRIDEDDYPRLATLAAAGDFLTRAPDTPRPFRPWTVRGADRRWN